MNWNVEIVYDHFAIVRVSNVVCYVLSFEHEMCHCWNSFHYVFQLSVVSLSVRLLDSVVHMGVVILGGRLNGILSARPFLIEPLVVRAVKFFVHFVLDGY